MWPGWSTEYPVQGSKDELRCMRYDMHEELRFKHTVCGKCGSFCLGSPRLLFPALGNWGIAHQASKEQSQPGYMGVSPKYHIERDEPC